MSLLATLALAASGAASGAVLPHCSWDKPGVNPFMGDVVAAVDRYTDIPAATRAKLKERMKKRDYDELVSIQRDGIKGNAQYGSEIRDMHFGANNVCKTVSRAKWSAKLEERGLVYCEDGQCILVPTVCRNVSRIDRMPAKAAAPGGGSNSATGDSQAPLEFEPTSAGPLAAPGSFAAGAGGGSDVAPLLPGSVFTSSAPAAPLGSVGPGGGASPIAPPVAPSLPPGPAPVVPEPGTWALLLAGLTALGLIVRRRQH